MNCTASTLQFYRYTVGVFLSWCEVHNVNAPDEVTARVVRQYVAQLVNEGKKDTTVWDHARAIKTMLCYWWNEGYIATPIKYDLSKLEKKRLLVLSLEQLQTVLKVCNVRDKAIVLFMVDSGLRRGEVCALNWNDVDMQSGLVTVKRGKGGKARSSVIGARTRRALLKYRRTLADRDGPLFQTNAGARFTGSGLLTNFRRLTKRSGIHITPHSLRRTFVILSLRAGMDPLHLKALLGHADFAMVEHYAQMENIDLVQATLIQANLERANLERTTLTEANLQGANLQGTWLGGANLERATVADEQLAEAKSLKGTIMPDGTKHE